MDIRSIVQKHHLHLNNSFNLVASENLMSIEACQVMSSDLVNRYCMPDENNRPSGMWDYPNQEYTLQIQNTVEQYACDIFGGEYADVRPLSGNNVAYIIFKALVPKGGLILSVGAENGGHFTTAAICKAEGINQRSLPYNAATGSIDINALKELRKSVKPNMVFLDASMQLFPYPLREIREALGDDVIISYDASHTMGIIAGKKFQDPLNEGADIIHGSTHKSLFGPQKGLIVCKDSLEHSNQIALRIRDIISPLFVSNMHIHNVAALGVAFEEVLSRGEKYACNVVKNSKYFAAKLHVEGIEVLFPKQDFSENHQVICKIGSKEKMSKYLKKLELSNLHVNGIKLPFSSEFGLRFGLAEVTRRGLKEHDISKLAGLVVDVLYEREDINKVAKAVASFSNEFPIQISFSK